MKTKYKQQGVVLVVGMMMLLLLTIIGVSTMSNTATTERTTGNNQFSIISFQAAESAVKNYFAYDLVGNSMTAPGMTITNNDNFDIDLHTVKNETIAVNTQTVTNFCGEVMDPPPSGCEKCSGNQDPNCNPCYSFDVIGTSQLVNVGAGENHLRRGYRTVSDDLDIEFNQDGSSMACLVF